LLPLLVEVGLLREVMPFGNRRCYELVKPAKHHEHFICEHCGEVIEFQDAEMEEAIASAARKHGFQMYRHSVEILGACPRCAKAQAAAEGEKVP